jgi:hypothetical protein
MEKMVWKVHRDQLGQRGQRVQRVQQVNPYQLFHLLGQVEIAQMAELNLSRQMEQLHSRATELD